MGTEGGRKNGNWSLPKCRAYFVLCGTVCAEGGPASEQATHRRSLSSNRASVTVNDARPPSAGSVTALDGTHLSSAGV